MAKLNFATPTLSYNTLGNGNLIVAPDLRDGSTIKLPLIMSFVGKLVSPNYDTFTYIYYTNFAKTATHAPHVPARRRYVPIAEAGRRPQDTTLRQEPWL